MDNNIATVDVASTSDMLTTTPLSATIQSSSVCTDFMSDCTESRPVASIQTNAESVRKIPFPQIQQDINATYDIFDVITGKVTQLAPEWTYPPHQHKFLKLDDSDVSPINAKTAVTLGYDVPGSVWTCINPPEMVMGGACSAALELAELTQKYIESRDDYDAVDCVDNSWNCDYLNECLSEVTEGFRTSLHSRSLDDSPRSQEYDLPANKNVCTAAAVGSCFGVQNSLAKDRIAQTDSIRNLKQQSKLHGVDTDENVLTQLSTEDHALRNILCGACKEAVKLPSIEGSKPLSYDPFTGKFTAPSTILRAQLPAVLHTTLAMRDAQLEDGVVKVASLDPHASSSANIWSQEHCPEVSGVVCPNVFLYHPQPVQSDVEQDDDEEEEAVIWKPGFFALVFPRDTSAILARIFSFLSIKELNGLAQLSRHLYAATRLSVHANLRACYDQLWYVLGTKRSIANIQVSPKFSSSSYLNLDFCNLVDGAFLSKLQDHLYDTPAKRTQLTSLSLYYCYKLTDEFLVQICKKFTNLRYINLGKCFLVTNDSITALGNLPYLQHLNLSYVYNVGGTLTESIKGSFNRLRVLEIEGLDSSVDIDELRASKPTLRVISEKIDQIAAASAVAPRKQATTPKE